jgi:hypothetical protein
MTIESPPHTARIKVLSDRYSQALDLFSGEPLIDEDLLAWKQIKQLKEDWHERKEQRDASAL